MKALLEPQNETVERLSVLREALSRSFQLDTAAIGTESTVPSAGHCAAVAVIVHSEFGGTFVSTTVDGQSHWFNRLRIAGQEFDVDLTGDQFGLPAIRVGQNLFEVIRHRSADQLNCETLTRALTLARRSGRSVAAADISSQIAARTQEVDS